MPGEKSGAKGKQKKKQSPNLGDEGKMQQITVSLPVGLISQVDTWAESVEREVPGIRIGRAGAMRALVVRGLRNDDGREVARQTSTDVSVSTSSKGENRKKGG